MIIVKIYIKFKMFANLGQTPISNQQRIHLLKEQIRKADSINLKSPTNSKNLFQTPLQDASHYQSKHLNRSVNQSQTVHPLELKYAELEDKIGTCLQQEYKILESIDAQVQSLQQEVKMIKKQVERSKDRLQEKRATIEKEANQEVVQQIQQIKTIRKELVDTIQKKYKTIKTETMTILGNHFENGWQEAKTEISSKIDDLRSIIDTEQAARDEIVNYMVNSFGEQILKLQQMAQRQKQQRTQCHQRMMSQILKMEEDVTLLLLQQKKQANTGIVQLQNYLQELCFKIENHLLH